MGLFIADVSATREKSGHWLGFVAKPTAAGIRGICYCWQQRIDAAGHSQVRELLRNPEQLKAHLELLSSEDPEMSLDIIDALSVRVNVSALKAIELQAAENLVSSNFERAQGALLEALCSTDEARQRRAACALVHSASLGAQLHGVLSKVMFVQGSWLGLVWNPKGFASLRAICVSWEQKIGEASAEQIRALLKSPDLFQEHLDFLRVEDPKMCLDIIEALSLRGQVKGQLLRICLEAALDLLDRYPKRAEVHADRAWQTENDPVVLDLIAQVFRRCGREADANQVIVDAL